MRRNAQCGCASRPGRLALAAFSLLTAVLALLALVAGCGQAASSTSEAFDLAQTQSSLASEPALIKDPPSPMAASGRPKIVDLGSDTCLPCRMIAGELEALAQEYGSKIDVVMVDIDNNRELARKLAIRVIPTQVFLDPEGKELTRHEGFLTKEDMVYIFTKLGYPLAKP